MKEALRRVRESSEQLGKTIAEWEQRFGNKSMHPNTTYEKIGEIDAYLNNLRKEFPDQTIGEMVSKSPREDLERKYVELLLLVNQLINTPNYILGKEYGDTH